MLESSNKFHSALVVECALGQMRGKVVVPTSGSGFVGRFFFLCPMKIGDDPDVCSLPEISVCFCYFGCILIEMPKLFL